MIIRRLVKKTVYAMVAVDCKTAIDGDKYLRKMVDEIAKDEDNYGEKFSTRMAYRRLRTRLNDEPKKVEMVIINAGDFNTNWEFCRFNKEETDWPGAIQMTAEDEEEEDDDDEADEEDEEEEKPVAEFQGSVVAEPLAGANGVFRCRMLPFSINSDRDAEPETTKNESEDKPFTLRPFPFTMNKSVHDQLMDFEATRNKAFSDYCNPEVSETEKNDATAEFAKHPTLSPRMQSALKAAGAERIEDDDVLEKKALAMFWTSIILDPETTHKLSKIDRNARFDLEIQMFRNDPDDKTRREIIISGGESGSLKGIPYVGVLLKIIKFLIKNLKGTDPGDYIVTTDAVPMEPHFKETARNNGHIPICLRFTERTKGFYN